MINVVVPFWYSLMIINFNIIRFIFDQENEFWKMNLKIKEIYKIAKPAKISDFVPKKSSRQDFVRIWQGSKTNWSLFLFFQLEYAFQESGLNDVITQTQVEVPHLNPTKVSEKMSCETSDIFFPNLAYMWPIIDRIIQYFYIKYVLLILGQFISTIYGI